MKICNKCNIEKSLEKFYKDKTKSDGLMKYCKDCKKKYQNLNKVKIKDSKRDYYLKNKELIQDKNKEYYQINKEYLKESCKEYYQINKDDRKEKQRNYYINNVENIKEYKKENKNKINKRFLERYNNDYLFKLKCCVRSLISTSIRRGGFSKKSKSIEILGCDFEEFKNHIELQFKEGMTWENHGSWHLDHKIPISWADTEEKVYKLNHFINFQPLWAFENQSKNNRFADI